MESVMKRPRNGLSIIEVLICVAILGLLVGLILSGVQKARMAAVRMQGANQLRQLSLALHQFAGNHDGYGGGVSEKGNDLDNAPIQLAVAEIDLQAMLKCLYDVGQDHPQLKILHSSADPSIERNGPPYGSTISSIGWNYQMFVAAPKFPAGIADGSSNTILFAERYAAPLASPPGPTEFDPFVNQAGKVTHQTPWLVGVRTASFADPSYGDVYPITDPVLKNSIASIKNTTFQIRPSVEEANSNLLQTPYLSGLQVAMGDGSVRLISGSVAERAFWSAVTAKGGESAGID